MYCVHVNYFCILLLVLISSAISAAGEATSPLVLVGLLSPFPSVLFFFKKDRTALLILFYLPVSSFEYL